LVPYIDWTPFFQTWELHGKFPRILSDEVVGKEATQLYEDAQAMLKRIINEQWLTAKAVIGFYPANSIDDDIILYVDDSRAQHREVLHHLRQQNVKAPGRPNYCLSDFIAPVNSGVSDYLGGFAVTSGIGIETKLSEFEKDHDDYSSIMLKALADRLAEAFAEYLHQTVRRDYWGYAEDEVHDNHALIEEAYQGIRPAPGYPACQEHSEKKVLFNLLDPDQKVGIMLTENFAMYPAASVSGYYFAHPISQYFNVGKVGYDQVQNYAKRKNESIGQIETWLNANLNYK